MTRINSNTVDTTTTNSSMEEEMELLKNLISIEQRLQNLKRRKKESGHQSIIRFVNSADDSDTSSVNSAKKSKNQGASNAKRKRTKDTTINKKAKATIEQVTQDTFPYHCRHSSLFPGTLPESTCDQEEYAAMLSYNEAAEADFALERLAYIIHNNLDLKDMTLLRQRPRFTVEDDYTSLEMERRTWSNDVLKEAYESRDEKARLMYFPKSNSMFKPYISHESCHKLTHLKSSEYEKVFEGIHLYPGQLLHMPFSVEEQIVLLNYLDEYEGDVSDGSTICDRLTGRNLISIQLFLDDLREGKDQYEFPIEYSIPGHIKQQRGDKEMKNILCREAALSTSQQRSRISMDHTRQWSSKNASSQYVSTSKTMSRMNVKAGQFDGNNHLVAVSDSNNIMLCDIESGRAMISRDHRKAVNDVKLSCHNRFFITGGEDGIVNVYSSNSCQNVASFVYGQTVGHKEAVHCIAVHPYDEQYFISSGKDCKLFLWDIERKQYVATLPSYNNDEKHINREYTQICYGSNSSSDWLFGLSKISGTDMGEMGIFDMRCLDFSKSMQHQQPIRVRRISESGTSICSFAVSHSGALLVDGCSNGLVRLHDIRLEGKNSSLKEIDNRPLRLDSRSSNHTISCCSFSNDDRYLCTSSMDSVHYVYDLRKSSQPVFRFDHATKSTRGRCAAISCWGNATGSSLLATSCSDGIVSIWNPATSSNVFLNELSIGSSAKGVNFLSFNHDDTSLALGTDQGLLLYSTEKSKRLDE